MVKSAPSTAATPRQKQAKILRTFRKLHRITASLTFFVFLIVASTGILLAWKKHSGGAMLPVTHKGTTSDLAIWLPMDSLNQLAIHTLQKRKPELSTKVDRIDVRPDKGVVKFTFKEHYWEVQLDAATGEVFHVEKRWSDLVEQIHDGSIIDRLFSWRGDWFKLSYANVAGWSLLLFTITGFWLWYGPKVMRKR